MFSPELESLIQATLEDGVLEEYEKAALVKRAQNEGVDLAELEIYINSILQKRKKEKALEEEAQLAEIDKKKKEAFGRVCPNCGRQVPPMTLKCECGFEFSEKRSISAVQLLTEKLEEIRTRQAREREVLMESQPKPDANKGVLRTMASLYDMDRLEASSRRDEANKRMEKEYLDAIALFPIPSTKEDIIDFLALTASKAKTNVKLMASETFDDRDKRKREVNVWREKFDQVLIKGRSLRGDSEFTQQLDYYEQLVNGQEESKNKKGFFGRLFKK